MEIIRFHSDNIANLLAAQPQRAENLAFGALLLDRNAKILKYNAAQGVIWGRNSGDMIGKEFFRDVALCCRNTPLHMRFYQFLREGCIDVLHEYDTVYRSASIRLKMHLKSQADGEMCWLFTKVVSRTEAVISANEGHMIQNLPEDLILPRPSSMVEQRIA